MNAAGVRAHPAGAIVIGAADAVVAVVVDDAATADVSLAARGSAAALRVDLFSIPERIRVVVAIHQGDDSEHGQKSETLMVHP